MLRFKEPSQTWLALILLLLWIAGYLAIDWAARRPGTGMPAGEVPLKREESNRRSLN